MSRFTKLNKFSQPKLNKTPIGDKDGVNLTYTLPNGDEFIPGTLEVYLSGDKLNGDQSDPERDYDENVGGTTFTLRLSPDKFHLLNKPPLQDEMLSVNYFRKPIC